MRENRQPKTPDPVTNSSGNTEFVAIGRVVKAHGLRGQVKVYPLSDTVERFDVLRSVFFELPDGTAVRHTVERVKIDGGLVVMKLAGIDDRSAAESLRGAWVSVERDEVAPLGADRVYAFDLVGLTVFSDTGERVGVIVRTEMFPANDVLVVESDAEEIWIPALKEIVLGIDTAAGTMTVRLPEGLPVYPKRGR